MAQRFDSRQTVSRDQLEQLVNTPSGLNKELDDILRSIDGELTVPFVMRETDPTADLVLNIGGIELTNTDTGRNRTIPPISNVLPTFTSGTVTAGATGADNLVPSAGSLISISMSASQFKKFGVSIDPNGDIVLQGGTAGASVALATNPPLVPNTHSVGYFIIETDGSNNVQNIEATDIYQYVGGGAGGSGSGDASTVLTRLWDKFSDSIYDQLGGVDFSQEGSAGAGSGSTGSYSLVSSTYELDGNGEKLDSVNVLDPDNFLTDGRDIIEASATVMWAEGVATDDAATYEITRNGGGTGGVDGWQSFDMTRVGATGDTYEGSHTFTEEPTFVTTIEDVTNTTTFAVGVPGFANKFTVGNAMVARQLSFEMVKNGSPLGAFKVAIYDDNAGVPGNQLTVSSNVNAVDVITGLVDVELSVALPAGDYHAAILFDQLYLDNFAVGVTDLELGGVAAGADGTSTADGTSWSATGTNIAYSVKGRVLDLRIRIIASAAAGTDTKQVVGYGVFYDPQAGIVAGEKNVAKFEFLSNTDNTNSFNIGWYSDPDLLTVYHIQTGQAYHSPAFEIDGTTINFPVNTFQQGSDETVTLIATQTAGSSFDNSDTNGLLLAGNHLGSTDAGLDKSIAGRGIFLRRPDGTLREITIDDNDNLTVWSV